MEKHQHINSNNNNKEGGLLRSITNSQDPITRSHATTSSEFVLQWGSRKRLRCMKVQVKDDLHHHQSPAAPRIRARVDRRVVRSTPSSNLIQSTTGGGANGHLNLRPRPASPAHRVLRNSESANSMKGGQSNGDKKVVVGNSLLNILQLVAMSSRVAAIYKQVNTMLSTMVRASQSKSEQVSTF